MPQWLLLLAFWLHMMATVIWLGYLAAITLWVMPALQSSLSDDNYFRWISKSNKRLGIISWISISILIVSGLIQMSANESYDGLLLLNNNWAITILIKHIVFFGMVFFSAYISWKIHPRLERIALLKINGAQDTAEEIVMKSLRRIMLINLLLGVATLALTALARIS